MYVYNHKMRSLKNKKSHSPSERIIVVGQEVVACLEDGETILDIGCGDMLFADYVMKNKNVLITGTDIINDCGERKDFVLCDENKLPFKDNSFDAVVACFSFHHIRDQDKMMKEAVRVSRNKIIVVEGVYKNLFQKSSLYFLDWLGEFSSNLSVLTPIRFRTEIGWKKLIEDSGAEVVSSKSTLATFSLSRLRYSVFIAKKIIKRQ